MTSIYVQCGKVKTVNQREERREQKRYRKQETKDHSGRTQRQDYEEETRAESELKRKSEGQSHSDSKLSHSLAQIVNSFSNFT